MFSLLDTNGQFAVCNGNSSRLCIETHSESSTCFCLRERNVLLYSSQSSSSFLVSNTGQRIVLTVDVDERIDYLGAVCMCSDSNVVGVISGVVVTIEAVPRNLVNTVGNLCGLAEVEGL